MMHEKNTSRVAQDGESTVLAQSARSSLDNYPACTIDPASFADPGRFPGLFRADQKGVTQSVRLPVIAAPPPGFTEQCFLQWRLQGAIVYETLDIIYFTEADLPLTVPLTGGYMNYEGGFELRCMIRNFGNEEAFTEALSLTLDWTAPYGRTPTRIPVPLDLPDVVITDQWLADNGNELAGALVDYLDRAPGDVGAVYWLQEIPEDVLSVTPVAIIDPNLDRGFSIPEAAIRALGDGTCFAFYVLQDAAGNSSLLSSPKRYIVNLGALPEGLQAAVVPLADDGVVNLADIATPVQVHIPAFRNHQPLDRIEVTWGTEVIPGTYPVGNEPVFPLRINVPAALIERQYTQPTGRQTTPVKYRLLRGTQPYPAPDAAVEVNLHVIGPTNPDWPNPVNPTLVLMEILSNSGESNYLPSADDGEDATAVVPLYAGAEEGEYIIVYWKGRALTPYELLDTDITNGEAEITVPWDVIEMGGNAPITPVHYGIGHAADADNWQLSELTSVRVEAVSVVLPDPRFLHEFTGGGTPMLNCASLRESATGSGIFGFQVYIPADNNFIKEGNTINLNYQAYNDLAATIPLPGTELEDNFSLTREHEQNGVSWFIGPYEDHILPVYDPTVSPHGSCTLSYRLNVNGTNYDSEVITRMIVIFSGVATCTLGGPMPGPIPTIGTDLPG